MIFVYVAGPFSSKATQLEGEQHGDFLRRQRAETEEHIMRAVDLGLDVARIGCYPVIPHANTAHPLFEKIQPYQFWIEGTIELMRRACDAMILVPGWEASNGARRESKDMFLRKKPVFESIADLEKWASTR